MKFLVLGASGMAGHMICIYLKENGHTVVGYSRRKVPYCDSISGDVRDISILEKIIKEGNFDAIINAAGILNQNAELDKELAVYINSYLPHLLVKLTSSLKTKIIQMSTDCVFSGKTGPYTEHSLRDGETFYDRSKALGEIEDNKNLTLRNSIVGPDVNENGIGLLNWFMKQNTQIKGYTHAMWTGVTTLELAKIIEKAVSENAFGIVNMVYKENISKFELLKLFNYYIRKNELEIVPFDDFSVNKTLIRTEFDFHYTVPSYQVMVKELSEWMLLHKNLYPHYKL